MKIIREQQNSFNEILSDIDNAEYYKSSIFNIIYEIDENKYLYNTLTGIILLLEDSECELLNSEKILRLKDDDTIKFLIKNRIIVPYNEDENNTYLQLCSFLQLASRKKIGFNKYTILPTTACNARCFYCFEAGIKFNNMSDQMAKDTADYILRTKADEEISIYWFGGEPLCNIKAINIICNILKENGVKYTSQMITNGLLCTKEVIDYMKGLWNINFLQFSMDGYGEEHNRRKNFVCGGNPFETIIENLGNCLEAGLDVSLRINIDNNNIDSAYELIDYLHSKFSKYKGLKIYSYKLFDSSGDCWDAKRSAEQKDILQAKNEEMTEYLIELGYLKQPRLHKKTKLTKCDANNPNAIVIDPLGNLFSCNHCDPNEKCGNIYEGITNVELRNKWIVNDRIRQKCLNCAFLPNCTAFDQCPDSNDNCFQEYKNKILKIIKKQYIQ